MTNYASLSEFIRVLDRLDKLETNEPNHEQTIG